MDRASAAAPGRGGWHHPFGWRTTSRGEELSMIKLTVLYGLPEDPEASRSTTPRCTCP